MIDIWTEDHGNTETPEAPPPGEALGSELPSFSSYLPWDVFWGFSCSPDAQITKDELLGWPGSGC